MLKNKKAQTLIEYVMIFIIVMGAFLAIGNYIMRGMQGRWKAATDDLGDQYDPQLANSSVQHTVTLRANTEIEEVTLSNGTMYTRREDSSTTTDVKNGFISIGTY